MVNDIQIGRAAPNMREERKLTPFFSNPNEVKNQKLEDCHDKKEFN